MQRYVTCPHSWLNFSGEEETFSLAGIVRLYYTIQDLTDEQMYVMTVKISICTSAAGCDTNYTILDSVMLPKLQCYWNESFYDPGVYIVDIVGEVRRPGMWHELDYFYIFLVKAILQVWI